MLTVDSYACAIRIWTIAKDVYHIFERGIIKSAKSVHITPTEIGVLEPIVIAHEEPK
jgi:hypothetical protein